MKKVFLAATFVAILSGCTTQGKARPVSEHPEGRAYADCVIGRAQTYAAQQGGPIELAMIAVSSCRTQRNALERVLRRDNSASFVNSFMERNYQTMIEFAAEVITEERR